MEDRRESAEESVKDAEDIGMDQVFNNPSFSYFAMDLYSTSGRFMTQALDFDCCDLQSRNWHPNGNMDRIQPNSSQELRLRPEKVRS